MAEKKTAYQRKLAHPDWQKKRLEVLQRDNFKCILCGSGDKELHVHHVYYENKLLPQDYPLNSLETLCFECHKNEEEYMSAIEKSITMDFRKMGADALTIERLVFCIEQYTKKRKISLWSFCDMLEKNTKNG